MTDNPIRKAIEATNNPRLRIHDPAKELLNDISASTSPRMVKLSGLTEEETTRLLDAIEPSAMKAVLFSTRYIVSRKGTTKPLATIAGSTVEFLSPDSYEEICAALKASGGADVVAMLDELREVARKAKSDLTPEQRQVIADLAGSCADGATRFLLREPDSWPEMFEALTGRPPGPRSLATEEAEVILQSVNVRNFITFTGFATGDIGVDAPGKVAIALTTDEGREGKCMAALMDYATALDFAYDIIAGVRFQMIVNGENERREEEGLPPLGD